MRKVILAIIMTAILAHVSGQNKNDSLKIIEQKIQAINNDTSYWTSSFVNESFLDTGFINQSNKGYGNLTGYFKSGKISKIRELIGLKLLKDIAITEYYFSEGKLIFVTEKEKQGPDIFIDSAGTVDHRIDEPTFEAQYFFSNDKMIYSSENGARKTMLLPNANFFDSMSKEEQLLLTAKKYYKMFSIKFK